MPVHGSARNGIVTRPSSDVVGDLDLGSSLAAPTQMLQRSRSLWRSRTRATASWPLVPTAVVKPTICARRPARAADSASRIPAGVTTSGNALRGVTQREQENRAQ
jgi:hypothetical protein